MARKIKITDNFYFTADSDQYILIECGRSVYSYRVWKA